jgi:hypothetical protein
MRHQPVPSTEPYCQVMRQHPGRLTINASQTLASASQHEPSCSELSFPAPCRSTSSILVTPSKCLQDNSMPDMKWVQVSQQNNTGYGRACCSPPSWCQPCTAYISLQASTTAYVSIPNHPRILHHGRHVSELCTSCTARCGTVHPAVVTA